MTRSEMLELLKQGKDPLDLSIQKWVDIVKNEGEDETSANCALCQTYSRCDECPVGDCEGTPFWKWAEHQRIYHYEDIYKVQCPTCLKLAKKELAFLRKLKRERRNK